MTEISIRDIFRAIVSRIWLVVIIPLIAVVFASVWVYYMVVPTYTAEASMYVLNKQTDDNIVNYSDLQSGALLTADYRELILSKRVLGTVAEQYGLDEDSMQKSFDISVSSVNNTRVIEIAVTSSDPVLAANLANAIGAAFSTTVIEIMDVDNVSFVDYAEPPLSPSAPGKLKMIALAGIAALAFACVLAVLIELLNTTIRTPEDIEKALGITVLARIPKYEVK